MYSNNVTIIVATWPVSVHKFELWFLWFMVVSSQCKFVPGHFIPLQVCPTASSSHGCFVQKCIYFVTFMALYTKSYITGEEKVHGPTGTRTQDLLHTVGALWPLSYRATWLTWDDFPCLIRFVPKSARYRRDGPFAARSSSTDPHWATKCHRGEKSTWPDQDLNPGPLAYRASTLTTELPSHMVDLWHL